ncbi:hypothetical protein V5O48_016147 [Marasmius crinis-equi]|uniref:Transmembrane protein n=1 Tax=Marasmius crinis-equi TaxID=585013 RepID=A0ABR3ESP7_9AGAR
MHIIPPEPSWLTDANENQREHDLQLPRRHYAGFTVNAGPSAVSTTITARSNSASDMSDGEKSSVKDILAVAGAVGAIVLAIVIYFVYKRRSQNRQKRHLEGTLRAFHHSIFGPPTPPPWVTKSTRNHPYVALTDQDQEDPGQQAEQARARMPSAGTYAAKVREQQRQQQILPQPPATLVVTSEAPGQSTETEPPEEGEQRPSILASASNSTDVDDIPVIRAQLSAVMQRLATLEAAEREEAEDPPDYVSSYDSH